MLCRISGTHFILWLFLVIDTFNLTASDYLYSACALREVKNNNKKNIVTTWTYIYRCIHLYTHAYTGQQALHSL